MAHLIPILLLILASLSASAADGPRSVFVKAVCDGKISSKVLSSFRADIRTSQKYELIPSLDDNDRMDLVLSIQMSCAERDDVAAVATIYGKAKCFGHNNCHGAFDVPSLRTDFCDSDATAECGRTLFKAFDDYMNRPNPVQLQLE